MPDPNYVPGAGTGLPQENAPQQPQYNYPQPSYQQPQRGAQQPQYGNPQQYGYQQQPQQPQYGYQQPQYGYQQPQYGYRAAPVRPPITHKKAIGTMVMMIIALILFVYPLFYFISSYVGEAVDYHSSYCWFMVISYLCLLAGLVLILVGAIIGSRGYKLFGIGLMLVLVCQLIKYVWLPLYQIGLDYLRGDTSVRIFFGFFLITGTIMAGIGSLARVKGLKIAGGILMLIFFFFTQIYFSLRSLYSPFRTIETLFYFLGGIFACIAVLTFPIRRVKA